MIAVQTRWKALAALALCGLSVFGCSAERSELPPGVLVITEGEQTAAFIRNFNPLAEVGDVRWAATRAIYEPMMIFEPIEGEWLPWLATGSAWNEDATQVSFTLREGVKWSDGEAFDADDVRFTFELLRETPALDLRGVWSHIEAIEVRGSHEIAFTFAAPHVPGFSDLAHQPIVAEHVWSKVEDPISFANEEPVGTGPFTEVRTFQTQVYELGKNPHYWQPGRPAVDAIRFPAFASNDQASLALVRGEIDWAGYFVPVIDRTFVARNPEHHHYWFPLLDGTVFLYANTELEPYDDVAVRKAISRAIDREMVVKVAMHGYTRPADATGLSDAYARWRDPEVAKGDWVKHDPDKAGAALDAAGLVRGSDGWRTLPDGSRWRPQINVPAGFSDWVRAGQVMAANLQAVGIDARLKTYDFGAWFDKLQRGDFGLSLGWTEVDPTPYGFYRNMMSPATVVPLEESAPVNWHRYGSAEAEAALADMASVADEDRQRALVVRLQQIFSEEAPAIPLFPGPLWAEFNTERFTGFPTRENAYASPSPNAIPQALLVLTRVEPRGSSTAQPEPRP
ncbi:ABC transporter substrate-binding protein [Plesiocystis pacifica]|uniref:ABC transporter substrate-binding protein n=1 Tax=Plesiocystis pacifica TaxID=191768 RepID=UPI001E5E636F|nr:ABC transporter substrate-binding protein [Plesiocystis pacifica]